MPGSSARSLPQPDLDHVLEHTQGLWDELRGGRLFVTGGTGFFGRWMLETFLMANEELRLGAEAIVLTRDADAFARAAPHVTRQAAITLHTGDVRSFDFPQTDCTHVLHMATEAVPACHQRRPSGRPSLARSECWTSRRHAGCASCCSRAPVPSTAAAARARPDR